MLAEELPPLGLDGSLGDVSMRLDDDGDLPDEDALICQLQEITAKLKASKLNFLRFRQDIESGSLGVKDQDHVPLTHPRGIEASLTVYNDYLEKIQACLLETDAKDRFARRITDLPAAFPTPENIERAESKALQAQNAAEEEQKQVFAQEKQLAHLIKEVFSAHEALHKDLGKAQSIADELAEMGEVARRAESQENPRTALLEAEQAAVAEEQKRVDDLEALVDQSKVNLAARSSNNSRLDEEIASLMPRRTEAEANANEALRISQSKDPKVEELGKWCEPVMNAHSAQSMTESDTCIRIPHRYQEQLSLLKEIQEIKEVRHPSTSRVEVVYEMDSIGLCTLELGFKRDDKAQSGWEVDAKVSDTSCPISKIVSSANTYYSTLEGQLSHVVREVPQWLRTCAARTRELEWLSQQHEGLSYDPETRDVVIHVGETGREFIVNLDEEYPMVGRNGMRVVAIEPADEMVQDEVRSWNERLSAEQIHSLRDAMACFK
ncbi:hypothetical protein HK104_000311 [Borealophlyctis nickersoniae]|nr:hypothetical protein HK104_000311 [Borealophlyctis nickersoniae]